MAPIKFVVISTSVICDTFMCNYWFLCAHSMYIVKVTVKSIGQQCNYSRHVKKMCLCLNLKEKEKSVGVTNDDDDTKFD